MSIAPVSSKGQITIPKHVRSSWKIQATEKEQFFISQLVVLELIWVLKSAYQIPRANIVNAIDQLTQMPILAFDTPAIIQAFIQTAHKWRTKSHLKSSHSFELFVLHTSTDLSDILIAQSMLQKGASSLLTFDRKAANLPSFTLLA